MTGELLTLPLGLDDPEPCHTSAGSAFWDWVEPSRLLPKTSQEGEREIPARYHRNGLYHTVDPDMPLWRQALKSIKGLCQPDVVAAGSSADRKWYLEYIVILDRNLAARLIALLIKHRPQGACLRHHLPKLC